MNNFFLKTWYLNSIASQTSPKSNYHSQNSLQHWSALEKLGWVICMEKILRIKADNSLIFSPQDSKHPFSSKPLSLMGFLNVRSPESFLSPFPLSLISIIRYNEHRWSLNVHEPLELLWARLTFKWVSHHTHLHIQVQILFTASWLRGVPHMWPVTKNRGKHLFS